MQWTKWMTVQKSTDWHFIMRSNWKSTTRKPLSSFTDVEYGGTFFLFVLPWPFLCGKNILELVCVSWTWGTLKMKCCVLPQDDNILNYPLSSQDLLAASTISLFRIQVNDSRCLWLCAKDTLIAFCLSRDVLSIRHIHMFWTMTFSSITRPEHSAPRRCYSKVHLP